MAKPPERAVFSSLEPIRNYLTNFGWIRFLGIECGIPFSLSHQVLFVNNDLVQRLTGCVAFLSDGGALLIAEMRLQECNDTDGVHDIVFAAFGVGGNAFNQLLTQCRRRLSLPSSVCTERM